MYARLEAQLEAEREKAATALLQLRSPESHQNHPSKGMEWACVRLSSNRTCGVLDHLLPGDLVLLIACDRGFNVHEAAGLYCVEVKIPKEKNNLANVSTSTI